MSLAQTFSRAVAAYQHGDLFEARRLYKAVLAEKPDDFDALHLLGVVEHRLGHYLQASHLIDRALTVKPDVPEAHYNQGRALQALGRYLEALRSYDKALALKPDHVKALNNRAVTLLAMSRLDEALDSCGRALAIDPGHADTLINRGNVLMELGREAEALVSYDAALLVKPGDPHVLNNKGNVLMRLGRLNAAIDAYDESLRRLPGTAMLHLNRVQLQTVELDDPQLAAMEELARNANSLSQSDQVMLHFALGKAYADMQSGARSFAHLLKGNALQRSQMRYDDGLTQARFRRIQTLMGAQFMRDREGVGQRSDIPVFIIGMLRSGTTLVEQILASHPDIFGAGELRDLSDLASTVQASGGMRGGFPEILTFMSGEDFRQLGARYIERVTALAPTAARIVDKMTANFQLVGLIHLALPDARIIHVRRDPIDTCLSCFATKFAQGNAFTYDLAELGRYYRGYQALMEHWRNVLPPGVMLDVQYEDVVANLEGMARRMIKHCGLQWNDACVAFHKTERTVRTASAVQVRRPIHRNSVGRWRPAADLLQPLLDGLNGKNEAARAS